MSDLDIYIKEINTLKEKIVEQSTIITTQSETIEYQKKTIAIYENIHKLDLDTDPRSKLQSESR